MLVSGPYSQTSSFIPNEQMGKLKLREGVEGLPPLPVLAPVPLHLLHTRPQPQEAKLLICSSRISLAS